MGGFARAALPRALNQALLRWYVRHYRVDLTDCLGRLDDYHTLSDFFTRYLVPGARPLCPDPDAVVSPADSVIATQGKVLGQRIPQGPHRSADVTEMLGCGNPFEGGEYAVFYLSPPDYHHVHAPLGGRIVRWQYLPGRLFPVFPGSAARVEGLYARNERLVVWLETAVGQVAVVLLGAFGVGRITAAFADIVTNSGGAARDVRLSDPIALQAGDELGTFHLGSTVILFFEPGRMRWDLESQARVRVRSRVGTLLPGLQDTGPSTTG